MSEEQIIALGAEVGLSPEHLRQALAEERTRVAVPDEQGFAAWIAGSSMIGAGRTVRGTPADVLATLDGWMREEECLQVKRRSTDRFVWERRDDLLGNLRRNLKLGGRGFHLSRASDVAATVAVVDADRVHVRLDADLRKARSSRVMDGGAIATTGGVASAILLATVLSGAIPIVAAAVPFVAVGALLPGATTAALGYNFTRRHRGTVERVQLALEQMLDRLEHADVRRKPSLLDVLTSVKPRR